MPFHRKLLCRKILWVGLTMGTFVILSACAAQVDNPAQSIPQANAAEEPFEQPGLPAPEKQTVDIAPQNTNPTVTVPFQLQLTADETALQANPGNHFETLRVLAKDENIQVWGKSPGGNWIKASTHMGEEGWLKRDALQADVNLNALPEIVPEKVQLVSGKVLNVLGEPMSGIQVALTTAESELPLPVDASTDEAGDFSVFLPQGTSEKWVVNYIGVACKYVTTSASCECINNACSQPEIQTQEVTLPINQPLRFVWK